MHYNFIFGSEIKKIDIKSRYETFQSKQITIFI